MTRAASAELSWEDRPCSLPSASSGFQQATLLPPRIEVLETHRDSGPLRRLVRQFLELRLLLSLTSAIWADTRAPLASRKQQPSQAVTGRALISRGVGAQQVGYRDRCPMQHLRGETQGAWRRRQVSPTPAKKNGSDMLRRSAITSCGTGGRYDRLRGRAQSTVRMKNPSLRLGRLLILGQVTGKITYISRRISISSNPRHDLAPRRALWWTASVASHVFRCRDMAQGETACHFCPHSQLARHSRF
ncbi:hypothetical protein LZ32DRAFT_602229 [Colletotrichum eremochloae]|nr:hypothetical protein LZ32DRAFT_602229 [Colletotrichum eremochloae]